jgi:hypothetical protein
VFIRIGLASIVTYYSMKQVKNSEKWKFHDDFKFFVFLFIKSQMADKPDRPDE